MPAEEIEQLVSRMSSREVVVHKLMFSPDAHTDLKYYCRIMMRHLASRKSLDLVWFAVEHHHTDHSHLHVVVLGKDRNGLPVRIYKDDHSFLRSTSGRYFNRQRHLQRKITARWFKSFEREEYACEKSREDQAKREPKQKAQANSKEQNYKVLQAKVKPHSKNVLLDLIENSVRRAAQRQAKEFAIGLERTQKEAEIKLQRSLNKARELH
ncbi:MAG: hypothetical protein K2Y39_14390 [Candidatus Obscuribacterales bacterium]|nr:hypothetical protein [Candidatus Obscuribacterales bacterium]